MAALSSLFPSLLQLTSHNTHRHSVDGGRTEQLVPIPTPADISQYTQTQCCGWPHWAACAHPYSSWHITIHSDTVLWMATLSSLCSSLLQLTYHNTHRHNVSGHTAQPMPVPTPADISQLTTTITQCIVCLMRERKINGKALQNYQKTDAGKLSTRQGKSNCTQAQCYISNVGWQLNTISLKTMSKQLLTKTKKNHDIINVGSEFHREYQRFNEPVIKRTCDQLTKIIGSCCTDMFSELWQYAKESIWVCCWRYKKRNTTLFNPTIILHSNNWASMSWIIIMTNCQQIIHTSWQSKSKDKCKKIINSLKQKLMAIPWLTWYASMGRR